MVIAVSGKGGVGKSTISALIVRHLVETGAKPVLAVDADPNSTLAAKLGVTVERTIGDLREDALSRKHEASAGVPRQVGIECDAQQSIAEGNGFDLVVMGRGEGPGCYCSVNNLLRLFLHKVSSGYKHTVVDNEAGMEHLSRRTDDKVDLMLIVSDPTPTSLRSAERIAELAKGLDVLRGRMGLVLNRVTDESAYSEALESTGLEGFGFVPNDPLVEQCELNSQSVFKLPADSPAVLAVNSLLQPVFREFSPETPVKSIPA